MLRTLSSGSGSKYSRSFDLPEPSREPPLYGVGGAMLPVYLNDLRRNINGEEMVEVTLELDDNSVVLCSVAPTAATGNRNAAAGDEPPAVSSGFLSRSASAATRLRRMFSWRRTSSARTSTSDLEDQHVVSAREMMKMKAKMIRNKSSAQRALGGLRFISKSTGESDPNVQWKQVEARFNVLVKDGLLFRQDFGECIGIFPELI